MTTYNLTSNIRSGSDSDVQNVTVGDTVVVTVLTGYTPNVGTLVNCSASRVTTNGSSSFSSTVFTVTPTSSGSYSAILNQPFQSNTYTLTGTASAAGGGGGGGSGYGLQQFDASSNLMLDTSTAVTTLVKLDTVTISLFKGQDPSDSQNYSLTGVTSQQDLDDNYIFAQINGGFWSVVSAGGGGEGHIITYVSPGVIKFTVSNNSCYDFFGGSRACGILDIIGETYEIYTIGKLL